MTQVPFECFSRNEPFELTKCRAHFVTSCLRVALRRKLWRALERNRQRRVTRLRERIERSVFHTGSASVASSGYVDGR